MAQELDKLQHSQRQEAAKHRREEKKKQEKEKMMNETDPEKTRKWEVGHHNEYMYIIYVCVCSNSVYHLHVPICTATYAYITCQEYHG